MRQELGEIGVITGRLPADAHLPAGLMGAGRTEVARAVFGADSIDSGEIRVKGKLIRRLCRVVFKVGIVCAVKVGMDQKTGQCRRTMGLVLESGAWRR